MNFPMNRATGKPLPPLTLRGVLWSWIKARFFPWGMFLTAIAILLVILGILSTGP